MSRKDLHFIFWIMYMKEEFLQIIGTGSPEPMHTRSRSSIILWAACLPFAFALFIP